MPVFAFSRQPDALAWFGASRGQGLLAAEARMVAGLLDRRPAQPWLWMAPVATEVMPSAAPSLAGRGLYLYRVPAGFGGALRCALPLPLPTEAFGSLIVQHALEDGREGVLEECARVLAPGGRLWLFGLNPLSPYRIRWYRAGLSVRDPGGWRERLRAVGLHPIGGEAVHLGPVWSNVRSDGGSSRAPARLRAVFLLEAEKRVAALIPPAPARRHWNTGAAPA